MRIAFTTLACPTWTVQQVFHAVPRFGYDGLEIRLLEGEVVTATLPITLRDQVRTLSRDNHVPIICLDTSISIAQADPASRKTQIQEGLALLALASEWEAPFIRVFANAPQGSDPEAALEGATECLAQLANRGAQLGVTVLLETHDVVATGAKAAAIIDTVPNPAAGLLWDTLHPYRMGETPETTFNLVSQRLHHVHIKDGQPPEDGGSNWTLMLLGEGQVPVLEMIQKLNARHYQGWLSVEWEKKWHPEIAEPEIALPQHSARLREYLTNL